MKVTVTSGEQYIAELEIAEELELENFLALCLIEIPTLAGVTPEFLRLVLNGELIDPSADNNLKKTLKDFGVKEGGIIAVQRIPGGTPAPRPPITSNVRPTPPVASSSAAQPSTGALNPVALAGALAAAIRVPKKRPGGGGTEERSRVMARQLFDALKQIPAKVDQLRDVAPGVVAAFEKDQNDFEGFHGAMIQHEENEKRKMQLMMDETSAEGQKYLAEFIERQNVEASHQYALEHMPEAFIQVHMLYIKMKINGHDVVAFVDSGAQVSILSERCARRCNVFRLLDTRYRATAVGVGGSSKFQGRLHSCQVQVEGHIFPCPFDVMADQNMDILFGLNMLRRHRCSIDLNKNVLRFGDGTETPFINEEEYKRLKDIEDASAATAADQPSSSTDASKQEVDSDKLAHLVSLGFDEEASKKELIRCGGDLETAANNLFARGADRMEQ